MLRKQLTCSKSERCPRWRMGGHEECRRTTIFLKNLHEKTPALYKQFFIVTIPRVLHRFWLSVSSTLDLRYPSIHLLAAENFGVLSVIISILLLIWLCFPYAPLICSIATLVKGSNHCQKLNSNDTLIINIHNSILKIHFNFKNRTDRLL